MAICVYDRNPCVPPGCAYVGCPTRPLAVGRTDGDGGRDLSGSGHPRGRAETDTLRPSLFQGGHFTLASGATSFWRLNCERLTADDWSALAQVAAQRLPSFRAVEGVPRGGLPFAEALSAYARPDGELDLLVADDVWTTGGSIRRYLDPRSVVPDAFAVTVFARRPVEPLVFVSSVVPVVALWTLAPEWV